VAGDGPSSTLFSSPTKEQRSHLGAQFFPILSHFCLLNALVNVAPVQWHRAISPGSFPTDSPLFGSVVIGTALIVVGLGFFPVLALGPIIEHFSL
jgi:K+-transporting ATPase ATPase A chain